MLNVHEHDYVHIVQYTGISLEQFLWGRSGNKKFGVLDWCNTIPKIPGEIFRHIKVRARGLKKQYSLFQINLGKLPPTHFNSC